MRWALTPEPPAEGQTTTTWFWFSGQYFPDENCCPIYSLSIDKQKAKKKKFIEGISKSNREWKHNHF